MPKPHSILRSIGPALIVAAVVCGPGSIFTASKVGAQFGYSTAWILVTACVLMVGMVALAGHLGVSLKGTPGEELSQRLGRGVAATVGIVLFLIIACFQSSNNIAVAAGLDTFFGEAQKGRTIAVLVGLNGLIIAALFLFQALYRKTEIVMKALVFMMVAAFIVNCFAARPDLLALLKGLVPKIPEGVDGFFSRMVDGKVEDPLWVVQAMIGTTFSVAGAFYQAYLVREKGWTHEDRRRGFVDSLVGITILGGISLVIMMTSAAVFYGTDGAGNLKSAADVAVQLEPLFGTWAKVIFSIGIFAGALSSFLVNAMIGGHILSDCLGLGGKLDQKWPRVLTVVALAIGMIVALLAVGTGMSRVGLIIFAQALTVLGVPALALALLYLGSRKDLTGAHRVPVWILAICSIGFIVSCLLAARTAWKLWITNFA